jgi:hypothetical protein
MRSVRWFLYPLIAAVLGLPSCSEQASIAAPDDAPAAQFSAGEAPAQSGPNVFRIPFATAIVFSGFDTEIAVAVGFDEPFDEHCGDFTSATQPGTTQIVVPPSEQVHLRGSGRDASVIVFAFNGPVFDNCLLVGAPVVATGTAHYNGVFNAHQGAGTVHGIVELAGGGQARLLVTVETHFGADGSIVFDHTRIRLTPI